MYDRKKLEAFLDGLDVNTHMPELGRKIIEPARTALDRKMDKYDIFKQDDYENIASPEFPILARRDLQGFINQMMNNAWLNLTVQNAFLAYSPMTYTGMSRGAYAMGVDSGVAAMQEESDIGKLLKKVEKLDRAEPVKIPNPKPPVKRPAQSPDYTHTITAWRAWDVTEGFLESVGSSFKWEPKKAMVASCRHAGHAGPHVNCSCGFWSFKTREQLLRKLEEYVDFVLVIGTVEIWGRVFEHKHGYRSEFAYPKELWLLQPGLESLSWTYGVPVRTIEKRG